MNLTAKTFLDVFYERLAKRGFRIAETGQPYLCRVVNEEIVQVLSFLESDSGMADCHLLHVVGGAASVYREQMPFSRPPQENAAWLPEADVFYAMMYPQNTNLPFAESLRGFPFRIGDEQTIRWAVWEAVDAAEQFVLPQITDIGNAEECLLFYRRCGLPLAIDEDHTEGWLCALCDCDTDISRQTGQRLHYLMQRDALTQEELDTAKAAVLKTERELSARRSEMLADAELLDANIRMLQWRKAANLEWLRCAGIL